MKKLVAIVLVVWGISIGLMAVDPTLPIGNFPSIAAHTFIGNSTGSTAQPTASKVDVANDIIGVLPTANGGDKGAFYVNTCNGTVGTAGTVTPYVLTPALTATSNVCNNTNAVEVISPVACTAKNLWVLVGTAGSSAGSSNVTLYKGGTAQALTCTAGISTTCNDITHTVTLAQGDQWSVRILTGQASDTIANVRAVFQCQ